MRTRYRGPIKPPPPLTHQVEDQVDDFVPGTRRDEHPSEGVWTSVIIRVRPWADLHEVVVERSDTSPKRYYAYTHPEIAEDAARRLAVTYNARRGHSAEVL